MSRHIFRLTSYLNIPQFLSDGSVWAKNHYPMQRCYQTSYSNIVSRRGSVEFATPCGGVVNDFVPFYFSPINAMAYTIYKGNVELRNPNAIRAGTANLDEIVYLISNTRYFESLEHEIYFTNVACNSQAEAPVYMSDLAQLENHINWRVFDEEPYTAKIPEIRYNGVCKYFVNRDDGWHENRSKQRMAEFLVKNQFPLSLLECIVVKTERINSIVSGHISNSTFDIPVYTKPDCYF